MLTALSCLLPSIPGVNHSQNPCLWNQPGMHGARAISPRRLETSRTESRPQVTQTQEGLLHLSCRAGSPAYRWGHVDSQLVTLSGDNLGLAMSLKPPSACTPPHVSCLRVCEPGPLTSLSPLGVAVTIWPHCHSPGMFSRAVPACGQAAILMQGHHWLATWHLTFTARRPPRSLRAPASSGRPLLWPHIRDARCSHPLPQGGCGGGQAGRGRRTPGEACRGQALLANSCCHGSASRAGTGESPAHGSRPGSRAAARGPRVSLWQCLADISLCSCGHSLNTCCAGLPSRPPLLPPTDLVTSCHHPTGRLPFKAPSLPGLLPLLKS